jgi:hypothetical protein
LSCLYVSGFLLFTQCNIAGFIVYVKTKFLPLYKELTASEAKKTYEEKFGETRSNEEKYGNTKKNMGQMKGKYVGNEGNLYLSWQQLRLLL